MSAGAADPIRHGHADSALSNRTARDETQTRRVARPEKVEQLSRVLRHCAAAAYQRRSGRRRTGSNPAGPTCRPTGNLVIPAHPCARGIVLVAQAGASSGPSLIRRSHTRRGHDGSQRLKRHRASPQHHRRAPGAIHHGGFQPHGRAASAQDAWDTPIQILQHRLPARGARTARPIRGGRRDGHAAGGQEGVGDGMGRHANAHGIEPCSHHIRHLRAAGHDERERPREEGLHKPTRGGRHPPDHAGELIKAGHVHNERVVGRPSLRAKHRAHRPLIERVRAKPVDGLRRKRHRSTGAQNRRRFRNTLGHTRPHSGKSDAAAPGGQTKRKTGNRIKPQSACGPDGGKAHRSGAW